ncbi:MAG: exodeoxyribonuclease VII small subunit [Chloroflexi bacterium]|nr:exodeoxyribonuclease VII small subunit [Chloroflexota bacterium]
MPQDKDEAQPFEDLYAQLEASVNQLEEGGLSLEASIELYERGMTLARECQRRLDEAELKITKLRESFATLPSRPNGAAPTLQDEPVEYEYVSGDDEEEPLFDVSDDPFE